MNARNTKKNRKRKKRKQQQSLMVTPGADGTPEALVPLELSLWQALYLNKHHNLLTKCLNLFFSFPFTGPSLPQKLWALLSSYLSALQFSSADSIDYEKLDDELSRILIGCSLVAKFLSNKEGDHESAERIAMAEEVIESVWEAAMGKREEQKELHLED